MFPVRCFTCGKVTGKYEQKYNEKIKEGLKKAEILDSLGMSRYCCRRIFLTYVNVVDQLLQYPDPPKDDPEQNICED